MQRDEKQVDIYLAEFEALRNDILARFEFQRQAFNYLIALLGASLAFVGAWGDKHPIQPEYFLFMPLLAAPLAYIFFDNEIMISADGRYIHDKLRRYIQEALGSSTSTKVLCLEERHADLSTWQCSIQLCLSIGRWLLFLLPVIGPIVFGLGNDRLTQYIDVGFPIPMRLLLLIDIVLGIMEVVAIITVIWMRIADIQRDKARPVARS
jgi:hypothetical protein